jgi:hypothetical protein
MPVARNADNLHAFVDTINDPIRLQNQLSNQVFAELRNDATGKRELTQNPRLLDERQTQALRGLRTIRRNVENDIPEILRLLGVRGLLCSP